MKAIVTTLIITVLLTLACIHTGPKYFDPDNIPSKFNKGEWAPELLYKPSIELPQDLMNAGYLADVYIKVRVTTAGLVDSAEVVKVVGASGLGFEELAIDQARGTTWRPLIIDGVPTETWVTYMTRFGVK